MVHLLASYCISVVPLIYQNEGIMKTITFKQYKHDRIHRCGLEFVRGGEVQKVYARYNDTNWFPSDDGLSARDESGRKIWEEGQTFIEDDTATWYQKSIGEVLTDRELDELPGDLLDLYDQHEG